MEKALGKRIRTIAMKPLEVPKWPVYGTIVNYTSLTSLTFGLLLDDEYSFNVLEKGPNADSPEAADFKAFWGEKSEMRRFHDGSICEAVLWPGDDLASKRLTCGHVIKFILEKEVCAPKQSLGTGEEQHLEVMAAYQELSKYLRQLKDIPLGISSVQGISPVFRHTEVFPPMKASRSKGTFNRDRRMILPLVTGPCSEFIPCCRVVCHLEDSGKWPDSVDAIQNIKTAFYIKISELLKKQFKIPSVPTEKFLDILQGGFAFRIEVAHVKELGLLKESRSNLGHLVLQENEASVVLEKRTVSLPRFTNSIYGVYQEHKSFGLTARLAKRWVASQLLSDHFPDEAVELLVASLYLHPAPFTPPRTLISGFQRFLHLLSSFDWANQPLIVNLNSELQGSDLEEIRQHFSNNRSLLPNMCIVTPTERNSLWTQSLPTKLVLRRLQILSQESLKCLEGQCLEDLSPEVVQQIFRPPIEGYDAVIHINRKVATRRREGVDAKEDATLRMRETVSGKAADVIQIIDFDPVRLYVDDLKVILIRKGADIIQIIDFDPVRLYVDDLKVILIRKAADVIQIIGFDPVRLYVDDLKVILIRKAADVIQIIGFDPVRLYVDDLKVMLIRKGADVIQIVDFDPVKLYVDDLKDAFGDHAMFFHDQFGGTVVGVKWKMPAFESKPTKVSSMIAAVPEASSLNTLSTVVPGVEGILSDFQIIGEGLVTSVEVFPENWKIK
ncbi:hypothetical protein BSL78_01559 [Apostichopus japonicus]|uniref:Nucleolar protein 6 n=1 Tax=Stichopus japonicus TaxID=307972 RepID=A0A2G8LMR1_STIJA|nr:hypothetical protein BSL78_01559 [Apostichopus japonicus]